MVTRLKHATPQQKRAATQVLQRLLTQLIQQWVPVFMQRAAYDKIQSQEGQQIMRDGVDEVLDAAENVPHKEEEHDK